MALSQSTLSNLIKTNIQAQFGTPADASTLQKFCDAIAQAVVTHITAAAVVNSTGTVTSGTGAGGAVSTAGTVS